MLLLGCGLLPFLRLARSRRELLTRAPLGYAVGLAATGIIAADLAVVHVPVGRILLPLLALGSLALGLWRPRGARASGSAGRDPRPRCPRRARADAPAARAGREAVRREAAARVGRLVDLGRTRPRALRLRPPGSRRSSPTRLYAALQHPLLLPALEAVDFRFMGALRRHARCTCSCSRSRSGSSAAPGRSCAGRRGPLLLAATLLALAGRPEFFHQLADELRGHPARDVRRARGRGARDLAADGRRRAAPGRGAVPRCRAR